MKSGAGPLLADQALLWLLSVQSISPMQTFNRMQKGIMVTASGTDDPIALPRYAQSYIEKAKAQGISPSMIEIPGKEHEILTEPAVMNEVANAVRSTQIARPACGCKLPITPFLDWMHCLFCR